MGKLAATVRTRFAPSPTGELHVGSARTALFNWLFAKNAGGVIVLRVEDTDKKRSKPELESALIKGLSWLGIDFDEGPHIDNSEGGFGPYRQSERADIYKEYADKLLASGAAYRCYCTKERLSELRAEQIKKGVPPGYDGHCRGLQDTPGKEVESVVRFHVKDKEVKFIDALRGERVFDAALISDFIIMDSEDRAAFLFASALDDALMEVTDVIRGDDHISNTPRQILLLEALGLKLPAYTHIPLILDTDRKPLSKRAQSATLDSLRRDGFLPEAVLNTIARLGWAPNKGAGKKVEKGAKDVLFSLKEFSEVFSLKALSKSAAVFDLKRLKRFNKDALRVADPEALLEGVSPWFKNIDREWLLVAISLLKDEAETTKDIACLLSPLMGVLTLTPEARHILSDIDAQEIVRLLAGEIKKAKELNEESYKKIINVLKEETGKTGKALFMPIRVALTGRTSGIELNKIMFLIGRSHALERIETVLNNRGEN